MRRGRYCSPILEGVAAFFLLLQCLRVLLYAAFFVLGFLVEFARLSQ